ncbi:MAG TPA: MerR family transcriptional regulator [Candidatus Limnocylindrales bacterium]|nr:MerR family transcriptional regulator [Candidatus Limnocylindrales bacterium]
MYKVSDFAEKAGVTVRTLHHYDRLGLLKPSGRNSAGYRLYGERDLVRLQQIATLKVIGLPLKQIKDLLDGSDLDLAATLALQRGLLTEKYQQIARAIQAIDEAERAIKSSSRPVWDALKKIIEVMEMESNMDWTKKYYSPEAQSKMEERRKLWTPELQARTTQQWQELIADIEGAIAGSEDPAGATAQALARRWSEFTRGFTGGDPEIQKGVNKLYADQSNWPANFQRPWSDEVQAFITKAMAAAGKKSCEEDS